MALKSVVKDQQCQQPGTWLEMQVLGPYPRPAESELLGMEPSSLCFNYLDLVMTKGNCVRWLVLVAGAHNGCGTVFHGMILTKGKWRGWPWPHSYWTPCFCHLNRWKKRIASQFRLVLFIYLVYICWMYTSGRHYCGHWNTTENKTEDSCPYDTYWGIWPIG